MRQGGKVITFPKGKQCGGGSKAPRQRVFDPLSHLNSGDNILDFEHYVWENYPDKFCDICNQRLPHDPFTFHVCNE